MMDWPAGTAGAALKTLNALGTAWLRTLVAGEEPQTVRSNTLSIEVSCLLVGSVHRPTHLAH
jgi:hypothetical protein